MQRQKAVSDYFTIKQILPFGFAEQYSILFTILRQFNFLRSDTTATYTTMYVPLLILLYTTNTDSFPNVVLMSGHRRRRCSNIKSTLANDPCLLALLSPTRGLLLVILGKHHMKYFVNPLWISSESSCHGFCQYYDIGLINNVGHLSMTDVLYIQHWRTIITVVMTGLDVIVETSCLLLSLRP